MNHEIVSDVLTCKDHQRTLAIISWLNNCRTGTELNQVLEEALLPLVACNCVYYEQTPANHYDQNNKQPVVGINRSSCCEYGWEQLIPAITQTPLEAQSAIRISNIKLTGPLPGNRHFCDATSDSQHGALNPLQQQLRRYCAALTLQDEQSQACRLHFFRLNERQQIFNQRDIELLNAFRSPLLQTMKMILFSQLSRNSLRLMELCEAHSEPVAVIRDDGSMLFQSPAFAHIVKSQKRPFSSIALKLIQNIQRNRLEWHSFLSKFGKRLYETRLTLVSSDASHHHQAYFIQLSRIAHTIGKIFNQLQRKGLTQRELEIALLICQGTPTREIAETIHLSYHTVRNHIKSIYSKLGVSSRGEMLVWVE